MSKNLLAWGLGLAACVAPALNAQVVRDSFIPPAAGGTAVISGTLVADEQTPQPIARARVELTSDGQMPHTAYTDAGGAFAFRDLAAGRYSLTATKPGFVRAAYGARRPNRSGTSITVADGQRLGGLLLRMARGSVITGTVRDEMGQPAPGVPVRVLQYRMANGERTLAPTPGAGNPLGETTDDRGIYRLFGLPAGEYVVAATPRGLGSGDIRQITAADLQAAQRASQPQTMGAPAATPPPPPPPITVTYAPVFYPGTTAAANAATVSVNAGEERAGVDFSLQLVRTARIEGTVGTPPGVPPQQVDLLITSSGPSVSNLGGMITFNRVRADADGRFAYSGIAPGKYTINARVPGSGLWASAEVTADGENLSGVRLDLMPGLTLSGRVVLDDPGAQVDLTRVRVSLQPTDGGTLLVKMTSAGADSGLLLGVSDGRVTADGRFTLSNITPGKYRIDAQLAGPGGSWTLKSAIAGGKDALDFPLEIGPNDRISDSVLTFTMQTQEVAGTLQDSSGRPAPDYTVIVFPADKSLWGAARRIKTARPGTDGRFTLRGLPAGEYRIAALTDLAPGEANDPALLDQLVPASVAFSLKEGERHVQDIRIAGAAL